MMNNGTYNTWCHCSLLFMGFGGLSLELMVSGTIKLIEKF